MRMIPLCVSFLCVCVPVCVLPVCVMGCFYFVAAWTPKLRTDAGFTVSSCIVGGIILNVCGVIGGVVLAWASLGREFGCSPSVTSSPVPSPWPSTVLCQI